ncbi:MAG: hypothetical protein Q7R79_01320 [bacterium]|nr:hypothetical protein [bacterium]
MAGNSLKLKDLWPIGALLLLVIGQLIFFTPEIWQIMLLVIGLSYGQNIAFALSSRAKMRNNVMYHMCAVLVSTFVSFITFRMILGPGGDFSLRLLLAYTTGTIAGSLTGSYISMWIEHMTGAVADADPAQKLSDRQKQKIAIRYLLGVVGISWALQFFFFPQENILSLLGIMVIVFLPDMAYSMRNWVQNRNRDSLTLAVALYNGIVDFFRWAFLVSFDMRWGIFVPYSTGGTAGSVAGSVFASWLTGYIDRKTGTKTSADAHVKKGEVRPFNPNLIYVLLAILGLTTVIFPPKNLLTVIPFLLAVTAMHISFALVSRARNRNNALFHLIAAMCSNGAWFFVLHLVATMAKNDFRLFVPYAIGTAIGGLVGVRIAMVIERRVMAVADAPAMKPQKA